MFCSILSYPYKKMSNSVVSRWTKNTINKLKSWKKNKRPTNITNNCDGTISKDTNNGN